MTLAPLAKRNPHEGGDKHNGKESKGRQEEGRQEALVFFARKTKGAPVRNVAAPFLLYHLPPRPH